MVRYTEIKPNEANSNKDVIFYYVFVSKRDETDREKIKKIRMNLVESLKPTMDALYKQEESWSLKNRFRDRGFAK